MRRHQLNAMPQRLKFVSPEVGTTAGLHVNQTGGLVDEERHHLFAFEFLVEEPLAVHIDAMDLDQGFARSISIVVMFITIASLNQWEQWEVSFATLAR